MSRSGYVDDSIDDLALGRWRGRVSSAMRGKRGQAFLREIADAMDAMPVKVLIANQLVNAEGDACAIGSALVARDMTASEIQAIDYEDPDDVANVAGIASCMAAEIEYINDECGYRLEPIHGPDRSGRPLMRWAKIDETPKERWHRVRDWIAAMLKEIH